ncbi:gp436 family protein [Janthinobacterium aquaticum]|uniref:gp436 family protein n=1 Tax=Janthinobacterium sp. FT58W TaxID=2654254 RepID=UPI00186AE80C|nr:DUF1320 domain-containing protein [Janthinobacterium sp. FT58W]
MTTAYATRDQLVDRYGQAEVVQRESMLPADAVDKALFSASAFVDGYISGRYSVPLNPAPEIVVQCVCTIARYNLLGESATERARDDYTDSVKWLKDVQAGKVLVDGAAGVPGNTASATVLFTTSPAVFRRAGRP